MNDLKMFTVEDANKALPHLSHLIREIQSKRDATALLEVEVDALELVTEMDSTGYSETVHHKVEEYQQAVDRFYALMDQIHNLGCLLKDIHLGLVDFYSLYNGRVVYLCWKLGEPEVGYWHEIGRGYAYRHPVEPNQA